MIGSYKKFSPAIADDAFVASTASVFGNVKIASRANIWFGAVIRADLNSIEIGSFTNVQDLSVLHVESSHPIKIGSYVTIGHRAILHGCNIEDRVLIGMGAIIMNGAKIGEGSVIGAGALVTENSVIPPRSLVVGFPGKIKRNISDEEFTRIESAAKHYAETALEYLGA